MSTLQPLPYVLTGVASLLGRVISIDEWADLARVPNRKGPGFLQGSDVQRLLGIRGKSWDPELFGKVETIVGVAREALRSARLLASEIDTVLVVTCTPYETLLDQDAFRLMRMLGIPDHVPPIQLGAGCAGLARAGAVLAKLRSRNALVITYNVASLATGDGQGGVGQHYLQNTTHPFGPILWATPGIFSDAAAALVFQRDSSVSGLVLYSRDSQSFEDEQGFADPLIHYLGGGANCPPSAEGSGALSCYGMHSEEVKHYYTKGMLLNHKALLAQRPDYVEDVRRIYTHQARPALVESFVKLASLPPDKAPGNAFEYGNLVSPCTAKLLHDDLATSRVQAKDSICISVVGAGPERGAFLIPVDVQEVVQPVGGWLDQPAAAAPPVELRKSA